MVTSGSQLAALALALADSRQRNATPAPAKERTRELVKHRGAPHRPIFSPLPLTSSPSFRSFPSPVTRGFWHTQPDIGATTHPPPSHRIASHLPSFDVRSCLPLHLPALLSPFSLFPLLLLFILPCTFCLSASPLLPSCLCSSHCLLLSFTIHSSQQRASLSSLFTSSVRPYSIS